ncbi:MAG: peptidyl-prolyl cis-trans isomerase, partial [Verrucomicrobiota bacterium]
GIARSMRSKEQLQQFRSRAKKIASDILDKLIEEELVYAEFKDRGFNLPQELIQERLDAIITREAGGDREKFREMLEETPINLETLRDQIKRRLAVDLMMQQNIGRAHVSPAEVKEYYQENSAEFSIPPTGRIRTLVIDVGEEDEEGRQATAEAVHKRSLVQKLREKSGRHETLKNLAEAVNGSYSEDTYLLESRNNNNNNGADEKFYPLRPQLREAVASLEEGERTKPVIIEDQILLLELVERSAGGTQPLDEDLREQIRGRLEAKKRDAKRKQFIDDLKEKHFVKRID